MLCTIRRVSGAGRRDVSGRKTGEGSGKHAKINLPRMGMLLRPRPGVLRRSQRKHRPPRRMQTPCRPPAALRMLAVRHKACPLLGLPLWKRSRRPRPLTTPDWTHRRWPRCTAQENIIRSARKEYVIKVADAVGMAHDELVRNSDNSKDREARRGYFYQLVQFRWYQPINSLSTSAGQ